MKTIIFGLLILGTIPAFAESTKKCESAVYEEVMSSKTVKAKLQVLLADAQENLEKISEISRKAQELSTATCQK